MVRPLTRLLPENYDRIDSAVGAAVGRRGAILLGVAALGTLQPPRPASATPFSAAGGAVFMNPNLNQLSIQSWLQLEPEQQRRRAKVLAPERAGSLQSQLDDLLSELPGTPIKDGLEQLKKELQQEGQAADQARELQRALAKRQQLMSQLDAQPSYVVYGAACIAAFGSTAIMHP